MAKKFTVQRLISPSHYPLKSMVKKKHEANNPEPGTQNLLTQTVRMSNLWAIAWPIKVYSHLYLMNNEV